MSSNNNSQSNSSAVTLSSSCARRKFTEEEDQILSQLVSEMGPRKWDQIAKRMPNRTARQCRDRYSNYLIPGFFNGEWSKEEDELLYLKYQEYGPKWTVIKEFFKNRSPNSIKNRWNYFVSRTSPHSFMSNVNQANPGLNIGIRNAVQINMLNQMSLSQRIQNQQCFIQQPYQHQQLQQQPKKQENINAGNNFASFQPNNNTTTLSYSSGEEEDEDSWKKSEEQFENYFENIINVANSDDLELYTFCPFELNESELLGF